VYWQSH